MTGRDALSYLQGQVSQDLLPMPVGDQRWTFLLAANGRVDVLARVPRTGEAEFVFDTDAGYGEPLAARLDRFKIRVKVDIEPVVERGAARQFADDAAGSRPGGRRWAPRSCPARRSRPRPASRRVAVDFKKGCYPGQELVERMDSRGADAPRRLRILDVARGAAPVTRSRSDGEAVGILTTVAGRRALGYVSAASSSAPPPPRPPRVNGEGTSCPHRSPRRSARCGERATSTAEGDDVRAAAHGRQLRGLVDHRGQPIGRRAGIGRRPQPRHRRRLVAERGGGSGHRGGDQRAGPAGVALGRVAGRLVGRPERTSRLASRYSFHGSPCGSGRGSRSTISDRSVVGHRRRDQRQRDGPPQAVDQHLARPARVAVAHRRRRGRRTATRAWRARSSNSDCSCMSSRNPMNTTMPRHRR